MKFSKSTIKEFQKIYLKKEGVQLSNKKAFEIATNLLLMFDAIYHPIPLNNAKQSAGLKSANKKNEREK